MKNIANRNDDSILHQINVDFKIKIVENRNDDLILNSSYKNNKNVFVNVFNIDFTKTNNEN